MATKIPQRELRNETARWLRRAGDGERFTITVHGHPVAQLGPVPEERTYLPTAELVESLGGLLPPEDDLLRDLRLDQGGVADDPFA